MRREERGIFDSIFTLVFFFLLLEIRNFPNSRFTFSSTSPKKTKNERLHNYPIVVATRLADPTLHNMWNTIGWILKCFEDYPDADW